MPDLTANFGWRIPKADGTDYQVPDDIRVPVAAIDAKVYSNAYGFKNYKLGPSAAQNVGSGYLTMMSQTVNVVAGRAYRISALAYGVQTVTAGTARFLVFGNTGGTNFVVCFQSALPINNVCAGSGFDMYVPSTTHAETFTLQGITSFGTMTVAVNDCHILIEDMGVFV